MNENQGKCRLKYALVLAAVGMWLWLGVGSANAASNYTATQTNWQVAISGAMAILACLPAGRL